MSVARPGKNVVLAYVLWLFFGLLGAHRFYLGYIKAGLFFLIGTALTAALRSAIIYADETPILYYLSFIPGTLLFVFWVIDAFKMPKLAAAAGVVAAHTNE